MARMGLSKVAIQETASRVEAQLYEVIRSQSLGTVSGRIIAGCRVGGRATPEQLVQFVSVHIDPDNKGRYTKWLVNRIVDRDNELHEIWLDGPNGLTMIQTRLKRFNDIKSFLEVRFRDINFFKSVEALYDFMSVIEDADFKSIRALDREVEQGLLDHGQAVVVQDEDQFKVVWVKSPEAAQHFGRNTKWCITTPNGSHFYQYALHSLLFIIIMRGSAKKYAYAAPLYQNYGGEFRDETNTKVPPQILIDNPNIMKTIGEIIEGLNDNQRARLRGTPTRPTIAAIRALGEPRLYHENIGEMITLGNLSNYVLDITEEIDSYISEHAVTETARHLIDEFNRRVDDAIREVANLHNGQVVQLDSRDSLNYFEYTIPSPTINTVEFTTRIVRDETSD